MKIVICEDEQYWTEALKMSISKWAVKRKINLQCINLSSPQELLNYFENHIDADVLFLDISFGEEVIDGMILAKRIRKMGNSVPIIFVTVNSFRAADGYLVEAMGFLAKPIDDKRLFLFLDQIIKKDRNQKVISIMSEGRMMNIYQSDIVYAEVMDHTITYYTTQGKISFRGTLGKVLETLDEECFVQIHRAYVIALDKIESIKTTNPYAVDLVKNNEIINLPVSRKYINNFLKVYSDDIWERY